MYCSAVISLAKAKSLPVQMGYMYRYNPAVEDCLSLVKSGRLGKIHSVTALMSSDHSPEKRRWLGRFDDGGGGQRQPGTVRYCLNQYSRASRSQKETSNALTLRLTQNYSLLCRNPSRIA